MDRATALRVADSVPGVQVVSGGIAFAWDAVPALGAILPIGEDQLPATPTGLNLSGLTEYEQHFKSRLRAYQRDMVGFLAARSYAINADPMRCLSGETPIKVRRGTKSIELSMEELAAGLLGKRNWDLSLPTYAQSMDEEGSVKLNRITLLHRTGHKFCLKVVLSNGMELVATPEHRIATPDGMKLLEELEPGDWVLVSEPPESKGYRTRQHSTYRYGLWDHPYAEKLTVNRKDRPNEEVARVKRHRLSAEAKVNGLGLEEFCERIRDGNIKGLKFLDPQQWHIHHLDGDHANDAQENLVPMTHSDHARHHGEEENWRFVAHRAMPVFIKKILPAGEHDTFDLTVENPHNNYVAGGIIVSNSGKTPTTLAAAALVGSKKTLIVCPSIAKLVWATEIAKWMHLPSTLLYGRGGDEARTFCVPCNGTGRIGGEHCPDCKAGNGQSYGAIISRDSDVAAAVAGARFTICNYDLLIPQVEKDAAGVRSERGDLPGWTDLLLRQEFDLIIADEAHILRGRSKRDRAGESRRDKLIQVSKGVPRFWALSGTPIYGRVADLWALLDVVTDGLYGRPFFRFDVRYANGQKGQYGWENDGSTNVEELKSRLDTFMLKRDRKEILPHLPPKVRQVVRVDAGKAEFKKPRGKKGAGGLHGALRVTAKLKEPKVTEAVLDECAEGAKVVVFAYLRENAENLAKAIAKGCEDDVRVRARNPRVWCVSGDTPVDARFKQAQTFREWTGCGIFVATIDSVPVAISLKGAQSVHFADLTFDPASLLQAEDRPYEVGTSGLTVVYYVVEKTIDEHVVGLVLPKMETLETVVKESAAGDFRTAFNGKQDPEAMAEEIWKRMEAAAL
jgi:hypothetical protein